MKDIIFHSEDEWKDHIRKTSLQYLIKKIKIDNSKQVTQALAYFSKLQNNVVDLGSRE